MKTIFLFAMSLISMLGVVFVACDNENYDYVDKNVQNQELNKFFYSNEYQDFTEAFGINERDFRLEEVVIDHYKNREVTSFCIPISKKGKEIGQILIFSKNDGAIYKVLYEDRTNFTAKDGGSIKIKTAKNQYIASFSCAKIDSNRISMKITDVAPIKAVKTRTEFPTPEDGWWTCTTECYKVAKDACGSSAQCDFLCDIANLAGGCVITMSAACAIYCI